MFGLSPSHLLLFFLVLLFFGPKALPQMGSTLGRTLRNIKNSYQGEQEAEFKKLSE